MNSLGWIALGLVVLNQFTFWKIVKLVQAEQPGLVEQLGKLNPWDYSPESKFGNYYAALYRGGLWRPASGTLRALIIFWYSQGLFIFLLCALWIF